MTANLHIAYERPSEVETKRSTAREIRRRVLAWRRRRARWRRVRAIADVVVGFVLAALVTIAAWKGWRRIRCAWRGRCNPARARIGGDPRFSLGGFRCLDCGRPGATLEELGGL